MLELQHIVSSQGPKRVGPFSHAVRAGDFLFVTGQMPTLPEDYYYHLPNNPEKGEYHRFNLSPKMKSILNASEGFFVNSGGCENYFAYAWK